MDEEIKKLEKKFEKEFEKLNRIVLTLMNVNVEEEWLDSADIKRLFNISDSKLYRMRKNNEIPHTTLGRMYRYPKSVFTLALLENIR